MVGCFLAVGFQGRFCGGSDTRPTFRGEECRQPNSNEQMGDKTIRKRPRAQQKYTAHYFLQRNIGGSNIAA